MLNPMKTRLLFTTFLLIFTANCYAGGGLVLLDGKKSFIFGAVGSSDVNIDASLAPNTTLTTNALDSSAAAFEIGVGYEFNKKYFATLAVQKNKLGIADINNIYGSVNYQFSKKGIQPFMGVLAGYSQLDWSKRPHVVFINEDLTSNSFIYGLQAGVEKKLGTKLSLFAKYQYLKYDHTMEIVNNTSNINHNSGQSLLLGLRYFF